MDLDNLVRSKYQSCLEDILRLSNRSFHGRTVVPVLIISCPLSLLEIPKLKSNIKILHICSVESSNDRLAHLGFYSVKL